MGQAFFSPFTTLHLFSTSMKTLFKYVFLVIVVSLLGLIPAFTYHTYKTTINIERFYWEQWKQTTDGKTPATLRCSVNSLNIETNMQPGETVTREVLINNIGELYLQVWSEMDSEAPIRSDLSESKIEIPPGGSFPVSVQVIAPENPGIFEGAIEIMSNDNQLENGKFVLNVTGTVSAD